jgi:DNA-binding NtrC family response regulator
LAFRAIDTDAERYDRALKALDRFTMMEIALHAVPPPSDEVSTLRLGRGETVMVVDDASERLLADEEMLAALGYEPVGFARADDALAACRAIPKRFDALLVSHVASAGSALDLAAALHESALGVPILLATAWADEIGVDALVAAGISEVVHRPLVSAELALALARCLTVPAISVRALHS